MIGWIFWIMWRCLFCLFLCFCFLVMCGGCGSLIVKVDGKLFSSKDDSICCLLSREEAVMIAGNLINSYPVSMLFIRNENRDDNDYSDAMKTMEEANVFKDDVKKFFPDSVYKYTDVPIKQSLKKGLEVV